MRRTGTLWFGFCSCACKSKYQQLSFEVCRTSLSGTIISVQWSGTRKTTQDAWWSSFAVVRLGSHIPKSKKRCVLHSSQRSLRMKLIYDRIVMWSWQKFISEWLQLEIWRCGRWVPFSRMTEKRPPAHTLFFSHYFSQRSLRSQFVIWLRQWLWLTRPFSKISHPQKQKRYVLQSSQRNLTIFYIQTFSIASIVANCFSCCFLWTWSFLVCNFWPLILSAAAFSSVVSVFYASTIFVFFCVLAFSSLVLVLVF